MMNNDWLSTLASAGARVAEGQIPDFGDPAGELAAARSGTVIAPLTDLAGIRAGGEDAQAFLHNLLTSDLKKLAPAGATYTGFCNPKGRLLASFLVWREGGDYLLLASRDLQPAMLKKLSMYVLRSKVKLVDEAQSLALLGLSGPAAAQALAAADLTLPAQTMSTAGTDRATVLRLGESRFLVAAPAEHAGGLWARLAGAARAVGTQAWRWIEIQSGIPLITAATQEEFVPQMANFDLIGAVNFNKGCYPGQEIVARTQYLGKLKKRMYLAHHAGPQAPAVGTALYSADFADQACGTVVNAAPAPGGGYDLLAVLQTSSADAADVRLAAPDGPRLALAPLPYAVS